MWMLREQRAVGTDRARVTYFAFSLSIKRKKEKERKKDHLFGAQDCIRSSGR